MKILRILVSGYRELKDGFDVILLPKTKVGQEDYENELYELMNSIDYPHCLAFIGKNASGKSTILHLISLCYEILETGHISYRKTDFRSDSIDLTIYYSDGTSLFCYKAKLTKPFSAEDDVNMMSFCLFSNQKLLSKQGQPSKWTKSSLFEDFDDTGVHTTGDISDCAIIQRFKNDFLPVYSSFAPSLERTSQFSLDNAFQKLSFLPSRIQKDIITLLDDSIKRISFASKTKTYVYKRRGEGERIMTSIEVFNVLSSGTKRGIMLFSLACQCLLTGKTLLVDEIEDSLHKDLATTLIHLFNDPSINRKNATLIFTTHYTELVDSLRRRDLILICQNVNGKIEVKNLYDYDVRCELSKSNLIDSNAFGTAVSYESASSLRKDIKDAVQADHS